MLFSTYFLWWVDLSNLYRARTEKEESCKGFKTKANVMMLSVTTIMFATSTTYWAFTLTISVMSVRALYHPGQITLQEGEFIGGLYIAQMYLPMMNVWFSFGQARTWLTVNFAVCSQRHCCRLESLGSLATQYKDLHNSIRSAFRLIWYAQRRPIQWAVRDLLSIFSILVSAVVSAVYKVKGFKSQATDSLFAAWVLSLATNVAATILIACKAW